jgi:predicted DNA-binding transcriptional regulator AlpA
MRAPIFISIKAACSKIGGDKPISPATYYRGVKRGMYPKPIKVSLNSVRVNEADLDDALIQISGSKAA